MQALDLLPLLIQTVEKAASQSTQVPTVTEGVAAALLLSKLSVADSQAGKGLGLSRMVADEGSFRVLGRSILMCKISQDQLGHHHTGAATGLLVICRDEPQGHTGRWKYSQRLWSLSSFALLLQCSETGLVCNAQTDLGLV